MKLRAPDAVDAEDESKRLMITDDQQATTSGRPDGAEGREVSVEHVLGC